MSSGTDPSPDHRSVSPWQTAALALGITIASWLGMQIVHEFGHICGALATGGHVTHIELKPWTISRTDVAPNPHPLIERWSGPALGCLLPFAAWLTARALQLSWSYLLRFFAGFCLIANGAYIGSGALWPVGDAADILRLAPNRWPLALFGLITIPAGLALWNRFGPHFGLGPQPQPINKAHTIAIWCVIAAIAILEIAI